MYRLIALLVFAAMCRPLAAEVRSLELPPVFGDSMVLQRGVAVPVWGKASPNAAISVTFGGQTQRTSADRNGSWRIELDRLAAETQPRNLVIATNEESITLRDILVGEVWLAAGQSNMEFRLSAEAHAAEELAQADRPLVRFLNFTHAGQFVGARRFDAETLQRLDSHEFYRGQWKACDRLSAGEFSAVAYFFAKELAAELRVPIGIVHMAVGGSPTEAWIRRDAMERIDELRPLTAGNWLQNESLDPWCRKRAMDNLGLKTIDGSSNGPNHPFKPSFLWETGIARIKPYAMRGVIWYQGESNSLSLPRVKQHELLFPLLVADWRKEWGLGEFPFYYCQLSSIGTEGGYQSQSWPEFRDQQRRLLTMIPNSGMAVTSDVGHRSDVHPKEKRLVGERLSRWALAKTYGKDIAYSGPLPASARRDREEIIVTFNDAESGLKTSDGKPPRGFEIAGEDGKFHAAIAEIKHDAITLRADAVPEPRVVRYGWQPFSEGNLMNGENLPASTFSIDVSKS